MARGYIARRGKPLPVPTLEEVDGKKSLPLSPENARVIRLYLERVAVALERAAGSESYKVVHRQAAQIIRSLKPD